jgi:phenylalanyl-tRNA synthetase alpha chain
MALTMTEMQYAIAQRLLAGDGFLSVGELAQEAGLDQSQVAAVLKEWREAGWVELEERVREELDPAEGLAELLAKGFPERRMLELLAERGSLSMREAAAAAKERGIAMNEVIRWGGRRGWLRKERGEMLLTEAGRAAISEPDDDERALALALERGRLFLDQAAEEGLDPERIRSLLRNRPQAARIRSRTERKVRLSEQGREAFSGELRVVKVRNRLTSEDITSGAWRDIRLREYDVTLPSRALYPARMHPFRRILEEVRRAFLQMGFTEVISPQVETAFWDFDALFQPQDHPAREMQDTFYLAHPARGRLPEDEVVERVRRTHEDGWETGSIGWGYRWDPERARALVLRTHTTATTIRALAAHPEPPLKVFCVGRVYRNESVSYKHLPAFFQVDGVIIDEKASLASLLGTLREFYRIMGIPEVRFKPSFFPYTEPSAEVFGRFGNTGRWIELGGSGVFRPEVTRPFGCRHPVLAWGLGLERLAMQRLGISDIRDLYWADLDRIQEVPSCR